MFTRTPIPQSVARQIQEMILSGALKAGERIPSQRDFSRSLKVSRASLREALLTLETLGLLKTEPGRGTFVAAGVPGSASGMAPWRYSDRYSVADVFETRIMLEGRIARLAALRLGADDIARLAAATDTMERCWAENDLLANVEADLDFHSTIAEGCGNAMLVALYRTVREELTQTQRQPIPITEPARMRASVGEHRRIVAAISARDGALAEREMRDHILNTARCAGIEPLV